MSWFKDIVTILVFLFFVFITLWLSGFILFLSWQSANLVFTNIISQQ